MQQDFYFSLGISCFNTIIIHYQYLLSIFVGIFVYTSVYEVKEIMKKRKYNINTNSLQYKCIRKRNYKKCIYIKYQLFLVAGSILRQCIISLQSFSKFDNLFFNNSCVFKICRFLTIDLLTSNKSILFPCFLFA